MFTRLSPAWIIGVCLLVGCFASGCTSSSGPRELDIAASTYAAAFDASVEAARREGLTDGFRDRRSGIIETEPGIAPNLLEPWHSYREPFSRALENTVSFERRRARFEFLAEDRPEADDLTRLDEPLQLRVYVFVERSHSAGVRRSTWTRRATTRTEIIEDERVGRSWVPVGRDPAMERRLLAQVQTLLAD